MIWLVDLSRYWQLMIFNRLCQTGDNHVSDTATRFTAHSKKAASIQKLLSTSITRNSSFSRIEEAVAFYTDDLPNPTIMGEEFAG